MPHVLTTDPAHASLLAERVDACALIVGLCAAWCGTCREFAAVFQKVADAYPDATFVWLDIEDDSALAGDIDVENFPSLAVFREGQPVHFGVTLPQQGVIVRLLAGLLADTPRPVAVATEVAQLPALLHRHAQAALSE